ncbi:MAG: PglZ domain-containing protein [Prevotellaceae bacterium]|jgi:DNA-binding response OmpR family regulator|nr:PglZ domain-containing protein [Prevotellaceae bacterium]
MKILWVDDEIDMLRPHILFLESKGYEVDTATNGQDALERCGATDYHAVFLDEHMPGMSGLQTLSLIKELHPALPVVMITKSEEENIMNMAIGQKITDYLIKPVNPNQIWLSLKKILQRNDLVNEAAQTAYRQDFGKIGMQIDDSLTANDWMELYRRLVYWELELEATHSPMSEMLAGQKQEANAAFAKFIKRNYTDWLAAEQPGRPMLSPDLFKHTIFPLLDRGEQIFLVVLDNFRYDQWRMLATELSELFNIDEQLYFSILPTTTQYARNALFSGLMPDRIATLFPDLWVDEEAEEHKNLNEALLIRALFERYRRNDTFAYHKINDTAAADRLLTQLPNAGQALTVAVFNFIDILSHSRTENKTLRELIATEAAYRSITLSWFRHSPLRQLLDRLAQRGKRVIITTDHGSIRVNRAVKVQSNSRDINSNLRYKVSRNISYNPKQVFEITHPADAHLPAPNVSSRYVFATGSDFFAYPNDYNRYVSHYTDTFQHGGVSMEEMIIPLISLTSK